MKLPFFAALIVFVVAVASTQLALRLANREADQQIERLANVYLDGLKASTQPFIEAENWPAVDAGFRRAFTVQKGVAEVGLYLVDSHGSALVSTATGASPTIPPSISSGAQSFRLDSSAGLAWVRRSTTSDEKHALVAALDVSDTISARGRLFWSVALLDLIIAALCGLVTYLVLRRMGRPIDGLLALLQDGASTTERVGNELHITPNGISPTEVLHLRDQGFRLGPAETTGIAQVVFHVTQRSNRLDHGLAVPVLRTSRNQIERLGVGEHVNQCLD